jgi:hypothetical protein
VFHFSILAGVTAERDITFDAKTGILTFHFTMMGVVQNKSIDTYDWMRKVDWLLESTIPKIHNLGMVEGILEEFEFQVKERAFFSICFT